MTRVANVPTIVEDSAPPAPAKVVPPPAPRGAEILVKGLIKNGVDTVFGLPGGAVLHIYDEIWRFREEITHYLVRHEQGAVHAAEGYARATGKFGVALVTSGPGATNAVTGIATAYMDSIPLVVITGQVPIDDDRNRRFSGSRHVWHNSADRQTQLSRAEMSAISKRSSTKPFRSQNPANRDRS